jgi:hypothetical protein
VLLSLRTRAGLLRTRPCLHTSAPPPTARCPARAHRAHTLRPWTPPGMAGTAARLWYHTRLSAWAAPQVRRPPRAQLSHPPVHFATSHSDDNTARRACRRTSSRARRPARTPGSACTDRCTRMASPRVPAPSPPLACRLRAVRPLDGPPVSLARPRPSSARVPRSPATPARARPVPSP